MALPRRERALAFVVSVILCSVLSSSLSLIARENDGILSGMQAATQGKSGGGQSMPEAEAMQENSAARGFTSWFWSRAGLRAASEAHGTKHSGAETGKNNTHLSSVTTAMQGIGVNNGTTSGIRLVKEVATNGSRTSPGGGGMNTTTDRVRMTDVTSQGQGGLRGGGGLTMALACLMGVMACALTVIGAVTLLRAPVRATAESADCDERLPMTVAENQSEPSGEQDGDDRAKYGRKKNDVGEVVDGLVRDLLDEIAPEEAV